jgi:uncharacterized OB-fold protein
MTVQRPVPVSDDPDTGGFFTAAGNGRLVVRHCLDCGESVHLPAPACPGCGSWNTSWREVSPHGRVYSWTVVERQFRAAFPAPYTVVIVELDEAPGVRLVGYLPGRPALAAGTPLSADFEQFDTVSLPRWHLDVGTADGVA